MIPCGQPPTAARVPHGHTKDHAAQADFLGKGNGHLHGNPIDDGAAVSGELQLVPDEKTRKELEADYKKMSDEGILLGKSSRSKMS